MKISFICTGNPDFEFEEIYGVNYIKIPRNFYDDCLKEGYSLIELLAGVLCACTDCDAEEAMSVSEALAVFEPWENQIVELRSGNFSRHGSLVPFGTSKSVF